MLESFLLLVPTLLGGVVFADDYPTRTDLDVLHYAFALELQDGSREIDGHATIEIAVLARASREIAFDLVDTASVDGDGGMTVAAVLVDGDPAEFRHQDSRLRITLPTEPAPDTRIGVEIDYRGTPADALGIGENPHGTWSWFSDNWPNKARHWLPTVDHPYDKASSEMIVTAPSDYQVVSNGLLIEESDLGGGRRRTHWRQSVPIATWLYTLGVTRFAVQNLRPFEGKPVQTWVFAEDRDAGFSDFAEPTHHVLAFFSERVGPFSYEKLANIQSARTRGGMEAASAIMYDARSVTGERSIRWRNVVIHEIAHQWFGNAVTEADWDDVWLSEGFATYFTLLFIEHAYGHDEFLAGLRQSRDTVLEYTTEHPDETVVHDDLDDMSQVTSRNTYQKGAWVLHMLRSLIGDEAFWRGIREYYRVYRDRNCTTADFRREMERASGLELQWFFDQWLRRGGVPSLEWSWSWQSGRLLLQVEQTHDGDGFRLPIEVWIQTEDGEPERTTVWLEQRRQLIELSAPARPTEVRLDPDIELLASSHESG